MKKILDWLYKDYSPRSYWFGVYTTIVGFGIARVIEKVVS